VTGALKIALLAAALGVWSPAGVAAQPGLAPPAGDAVATARALLAAWHEDPSRIDRARAALEAAAAAQPRPEIFVELSRVWFLTGDFRVRTTAERSAAYGHGSDAARRAIAAAPRDDRAHLWLAINTGRAAEIRGPMRALALVATVREESETVLRLNPSNVEGLILAGGIAADMPAVMGGDRAKAEALFRRALEMDPHQTGARLELARLYLASRRWRDAERELIRVRDEPAPTDRPRWMASERPRAREFLAELQGQGRATPTAPQAP
jgi:tetratricopeptide (TPR) repeat protein